MVFGLFEKRTPADASEWKAPKTEKPESNPRMKKEVERKPVEVVKMTPEEAATFEKRLYQQESKRQETSAADRAAFEIYGSKGRGQNLKGREIMGGRDLPHPTKPDTTKPIELDPSDLEELEEITEEDKMAPPPFATYEERKHPGKWLN